MRRAIKPAFVAVFVLVAGVFLRGGIPHPATGNWLAAGSMTVPRGSAASALLQDGRILITGGDSGSGPVAGTEFFDTIGAFVAGPPMGMARSAHTATVLADGRVLVAGGSIGAAATNAAEIFDPIANTWTPVAGGMIQARLNHTASLLSDGRVLFAGGENAGVATASLEIFDPVAGSFSSVGAMSTPRTSFASVILSNGEVLLVGGSNGTSNGNLPLATTEIFDSLSNSVTAGPALSVPRMSHSATTLLNGQVLVAGGTGLIANPDNSTNSVDLASAEIFDPTAGTFTASASTLATARSGHLAVLLPHNNNVLIVGGTSAGLPLATSELFTPWLGTFASTGTMANARSSSIGSALQQDGLLLVAGGKDASSAALSSSELYGFATVKTDAADYPPGSVVTITGRGWQPGETVTLTLVESPLIDTHGPFTVVADSAGNISNSSFVTDDHDLNIRFYLTAAGSVSQAQATFTDAKNLTIAFSGTGSGSVTGTGGYNCTDTAGAASGTCAESLNNNDVVSFTATPAAGFGIEAWTTPNVTVNSGCTPGNAVCVVTMGAVAATVTVTINPATTLSVSAASGTYGGSTGSITAHLTKTSGGTNISGKTINFTLNGGVVGTAVTNVSGIATLASASLTSPAKINAGSFTTGVGASFAGDSSFAPSSATAALTVSAKTITVTAATNNKTYDGTTSAAAVPTITAGGPLVPGDTANFIETYDTKNAGSGKTLTPSGIATDSNSGNNYTYTFITNTTGVINARVLTVTAATNTKTYDGTTSAAAAPTITVGTVQTGDTANFTETYDTVNVGTGKTLTPAGTVTDGNSGNNYTYTFVANTTGVIATASTSTTITNSAALATASIVNQSYAVNYSLSITAPGGGSIPATDTVFVSDGSASCTGTIAAATCDLTSTTTGAKTITAKYNGSSNYAASNSTGVPHTVGQAPAITSVSSTTFTVNSSGTFAVTATGFPAPTFSESGALPSGVTLNSTAGVLSGTPALGSVGSYPITITATNGVGSDAIQAFTLTVSKITSTLSALTASQSIPYGQASIGLSGKVNGYPMMTGTVTITIGGVSSAPLQLNGTPNNFSDTAFDTHTFPVSGSSYTISYAYSGDANSSSASDTSTTLTVTKVTPTVHWATPTAITFNTALSTTQLNATFTAVVNGATVQVAGTPTYNPAASTVLNADAAQTLNVNFVPTDTTDYNNASGSVSLTVNKAATSTAQVVSSQNPSFSGKPVTFTATVSNTSGTSAVPTGSVQFFDGATSLGSSPVVSGTASLATSALSVTTHSITAVYSNSDGNFTGSTSTTPLSQVVKSAATTTTVSSSKNPSTFGDSISFTAAVAPQDPSAGTPTGSVQFQIDGVNFGASVPLVSCAPSPDACAASGSISSLTVPSHAITAIYTPDVNFVTSTVNLTQTVNKATPTLAWTPTSLGPITYGTNLTGLLTASSGAVAGSFAYSNGATPVTAATVLNASATAYTLTATFTPTDTGNYVSGGTVNNTLTVSKANQTISFTMNAPATAAYNTGFNVAATASSGLTVTFSSGGVCSNNAPTFSMNSGTGVCSVKADQAGDSNYNAAPQVTQTTNALLAGQTIAFTGAPASAQFAASFPVSASASSGLAVTLGASGACSISGNLVTMTSGTGTCQLTADQSGDSNYSAALQATQMTAALPAPVIVSVPSITVTYDGSPKNVSPTLTPLVSYAEVYTGNSPTSYGPTSSAPTEPGSYSVIVTVTDPNYVGGGGGTLTINQKDPALTLALLSGMPEPSPYGTRVYFELRAAKSPCPTGQVQFFVDGSNTTSLMVTLDGSNCSSPIEFSTATLTPGTHTVNAVYSGDAHYLGQTSNTVSHSVIADGTGVTLATSAMTVFVGDSVTFTATVTPSTGVDGSAASPSGTVQFVDAGSGLLGSSPLSGNTATFSTTSLAAGSHSITANYVSDTGDFSGSSSPVNLESVNKITPVINWPAPGDIVYGTKLSATQLDATSIDHHKGDIPVAGTFVYDPAADTVLLVGHRNLSVTFTPDDTATYASPQTATVTINVTQATLTVTADDASRPYGADNPSFTFKYSGFVNNEDLGIVTTPPTCTSAADSNSSVGTYPITCSGGSAPNYTFSYVAGTLTVTRADANISVTPYIVTYDGNPHTATATATGAHGESLLTELDLTGTTHTNAGNYTDTWTFTDTTGNYNNASATVKDCVKKANATIVVTPYNVTYDGNAHTATYTITGVHGETGATVGTVTLNTTHSNAGDYSSDTWSFTGAANYNDIASMTITDSIGKRVASVSAVANSKTYGGSDPALATTNSYFVAGDLGGGKITFSASRAPGESVAGSPYLITPAASDSGTGLLGNYSITYNTAKFTITPAPLTITASSGSMIYGGPVFPAGASYSGFVNGDTPASLTPQPTCVTMATSLSPVAGNPYVSSCSGATDSNYTISYINGIVTVTPATSTTTVISSVNPSTYMQLVTFTATVSPQYAGTIPTGIVTFFNNGSQVGTGMLSVSSCGPPPCPVQATFSTSSLPDSGPDSITAAYSGDSNFNGGVSPAIVQTVQPAPNVSLNPQSVSFGNTNVNTTSKPAMVTLKNIGDAPLSIVTGGISIAPSTDFFQTNNCGSSVAAGGSCSISITFTPIDTGIRTASLQITDNDDDATNAQQTVSLTGAGLTTITGGSLYTDAIFATANGCGSIVMSGGSTVDSFSSALGYPASHQLSNGNVGTNGNVTLNGSKSAIYGSAAVNSATTGNCSKSSVPGVTINGGAQVTGGLVPLNGQGNYPTPPAPNPATPTSTQNLAGSCGTISGCTNIGSKAVSLSPGQYGNLTLSGGTTAHFSKGTYNINSLTLSGQSVLYVDSWPVVVNLAGASLNGSNPVMDSTGGSMQNPSGIPANLQITYAGSRGINLSGGANSYATVYAPNALVNMSGGTDFFGSVIASTVTNSGGTAFHGDTTLPNIPAYDFIWFNAVVNNVSGLPSGSNQVKLYLTNSTISFTANGTSYMIPVPNGVVTFNSVSQGSGAKTSYDLTSSRWSTSVAKSGLTGNTFVTGLAFPVPAGGFPTGIQNVAWSASYSTDTPGITLQWQWGAAVYSSFNSPYATTVPTANNNVLGVNAEDGSADMNGTDPAGTPETYKASVTFGATGGGLTNYTGYLTPAAGVVPTVAPISVSPSSLNFGPQAQGTSSAAMTATLTNNDSSAHTISAGMAGISVMGSDAGDFTQTNNCPVAPSTLTGGSSCTIAVVFTPGDVGTRTAKIVVNDDANNSPQTVYLSGTGQ